MVASRCNFSLSVCMCHSIASPLHPVHLFSSSILFSQNLNVPPPSSRLLSLFLAFFEPLEKGCFSAVQAKDKSPHTHTHAHTHLILWVLTTKWHTVWMLYLYVSVLCPWHFCNYLWVKKNIKMLRALVKCCTGSTKGGVGVLLASQTVIQTESWGVWGWELLVHILQTCSANHLLPDTLAYAHAHTQEYNLGRSSPPGERAPI